MQTIIKDSMDRTQRIYVENILTQSVQKTITLFLNVTRYPDLIQSRSHKVSFRFLGLGTPLARFAFLCYGSKNL